MYITYIYGYGGYGATDETNDVYGDVLFFLYYYYCYISFVPRGEKTIMMYLRISSLGHDYMYDVNITIWFIPKNRRNILAY